MFYTPLREITASNYLFNGSGVITGSVTIGTSATILGTLSAGSIATPSSGPPFKSEINSAGFARFTSASIAGWHIDSTTISSPDEKVIIDSSNKRITINNTTFGSEGIQLDYNGGTPRFFAGSASKFVKFDGSDVDIKTEKLTASGSSINLGAPSFRLGSTGNFISGSGGSLVIQSSGTTTLSGSAVNILTPSFFMGATGSAFVSGSGGKLEISSSKFHIKSSGDLIVRKINATDGTIGGFTVNADTLTATNFEINPSGKRFTLGNNETIFIADGDEGIQLGSATFANAPFNVDIEGRMTASSALITGSGVRIGVEDFRVKTPDFEIDTSTGKGFLKFGENAGLDSGAGMFVSESGQFALSFINTIKFLQRLAIISLIKAVITEQCLIGFRGACVEVGVSQLVCVFDRECCFICNRFNFTVHVEDFSFIKTKAFNNMLV